MALSAARLKADLKSRIIARRGAPDDPVQLDGFCEDVANAIVAEITGFATVPAGISVTTPDTINGTTTAPGTVV